MGGAIMKDIKIQNIQPVAEPKSAGKTGKKEEIAGPSFSDTLQTTIARMNDLKIQADATLSEAKAESIKDEISTAKEIFDKMMLEKKNLSQLYHHIKTPDES